MKDFLSTAARHWQACRRLGGSTDRALYVYARMLRRFPRLLPGSRVVVKIRLREYSEPFQLRLGSTDWLVLEEIFLRNEYSIVGRWIPHAQWIVDLGSNAGFSLRYWECLFPGSRMIAVEPEPGNCDICERNLAQAMESHRVVVVQAAVGGERREDALVAGNGEWAYRTETKASAGPRVPVIPLKEILDQHAPGQVIDLLKCDIEGAERELFTDCASWIDRVNAMVVELHPPYGVPELMLDLARARADFQIVANSGKKSLPVVLLCRPKRRPGFATPEHSVRHRVPCLSRPNPYVIRGGCNRHP